MRTVTVARGVTVPSVSMVIGICPVTASAARIVCGGADFSAFFPDSIVPGAICSQRSQTRIAMTARMTAASPRRHGRRLRAGEATAGSGGRAGRTSRMTAGSTFSFIPFASRDRETLALRAHPPSIYPAQPFTP